MRLTLSEKENKIKCKMEIYFLKLEQSTGMTRSMIMLKIADLECFVLLLGRLHVLFSVSLFPYCF
jgi:hypothetical protein